LPRPLVDKKKNKFVSNSDLKKIYWFNVTGAAVLNEKIVSCGGTDGGMI